MPFSGPNDAELPANVKKLPENQRSKWVNIFNNTFKNCMSDSTGGGAGSEQKCETTAFKFANGSIKKELGMEEENEKCKHGIPSDKCIACLTGATSFEEVEKLEAVRKQQEAMAETSYIAEGLIGNVLSSEEISTEDKPGAIQKVMTGFVERVSKIASGVKEALTEKQPAKTEVGNFQILKALDGSLRWIGIPTNKWRDRDNPPQIIEEKAHLNFVEYLERTKDFPELLSWHTPGTRIGVADFADYSDGFLVMGGPIDKDKYAEAEKLVKKCQKEAVGMSHGFVYTYSDKEKEVIGEYRTWEVSHLPLSKAANVWTSIDILKKEVNQMFDPTKRKYLVGLHGEDIVASLESKTADLGKDLESAGIEFKDVVEVPQVNTEELVEAAVKAIVETDSFKAMVDGLTTLTDVMKELKDTDLPAILTRIEAVEGNAAEAKTKAEKTADELISGVMTARSAKFQASKDGVPPTVEEKKKETEETGISVPVIDPAMSEGFLGLRESVPA